MDKTQKVLVKAGRKDLAQKYFEKISDIAKITDEIFKEAKGEGKMIDDVFEFEIKKPILNYINSEKDKIIKKINSDFEKKLKSAKVQRHLTHLNDRMKNEALKQLKTKFKFFFQKKLSKQIEEIKSLKDENGDDDDK